MTDLDTTPPVVMALASRHPALGRRPGAPTPDDRRAPADDEDGVGNGASGGHADADGRETDRRSAGVADAAVLPLNDAAAVYEALAAQIAGTAVGWSDEALAKLEQGLLQRYGPVVGGRQPIRRLIRLAARPSM